MFLQGIHCPTPCTCPSCATSHASRLHGVKGGTAGGAAALRTCNILSWHSLPAQGSDGVRRILDINPEALHQRLPLFLGSAADIAELESYGDVQQLGGKTYAV